MTCTEQGSIDLKWMDIWNGMAQFSLIQWCENAIRAIESGKVTYQYLNCGRFLFRHWAESKVILGPRCRLKRNLEKAFPTAVVETAMVVRSSA